MAKTYGQQQQRVIQTMPSNPGAIKTKKYALNKNVYLRLGMKQIVRQQWFWGFVPLGIILLNVVLNLTKTYQNWWIYLVAILGAVLYLAFWAVQFTGISQLEQYKQLFQHYRYEVDSRQILMKMNEKEGGIVKWDMIQAATVEKDGYSFELGRGQFIFLPFSIFPTDNDRKLMDKILKDKGLVK